MTSWAKNPPPRGRNPPKGNPVIGHPPPPHPSRIPPTDKVAAAKRGFVPDGRGGMVKSGKPAHVQQKEKSDIRKRQMEATMKIIKKQQEQQQQQLNPPDFAGQPTPARKDEFSTHRHSARCRGKRGNILKDCMNRLNQEEGVRGKSNLPF